MLDLKKLEKKLDEALENETNESLTQWLLSHRTAPVQDFLGEGQLVQFRPMSCAVHSIEESMVDLINENGVDAGENSYATAA